MAGYVHVEQHEDVALVRVDRPPANALDAELMEEVRASAEELAAAGPGAVVLTGREKFFSAGVDLKIVPTLDADGEKAMIDGINRMAASWYSFPRPVVCAVNGHAIAGGMVMALCGDYRVGCTGGKLGFTELRAGVPYPAVPIAIVKAELSMPAARVLTLRSNLVDPEEALALGLVDELTSPEDVVARALVVAGEMAKLPARAYENTKRELRGETIAAIERVLEDGDPVVGAWLAAGDAGAGVALLGQADGQ